MEKRTVAVAAAYRLLNQHKHASKKILHQPRLIPNFSQVNRLSSSSVAGLTDQYAHVPLKQLLASYRWDLQKSSLIHIQNISAIHHRHFGSVASTTVQRNPVFSTINHDDLIYFEKILGRNKVIQDDDELESANTDWMHKYKGSSKLMLQPENAKELSQILEYCNSRCLAVVPQGGNTGLVGGSVPVFDEIIINTRRMNSIITFDEVSGVLVCEAGCILENLISFLDKKG